MNTAAFSDDRIYRYALYRELTLSSKIVNFIGLNPSTADEFTDDPTIRRCKGYARSWGYGCLIMTNLFAWRSTDPKVLRRPDADNHITWDPVGPENDSWLISEAKKADLVIAAWSGFAPNRAATVARLFETRGIKLKCLGLTRDGYPRHPLYMRADVLPQDFEPRLAVGSPRP